MKTRVNPLQQLVDLPYESCVIRSITTEDEPSYLAFNPELPGCMSHGATEMEAISSLRDARELYIQSLIEDGLNVPKPQTTQSTLTSATSSPSVKGQWIVRSMPASNTLKVSAKAL